jgi:hypothetical protein
LLRKQAARTKQALDAAIATGIDRITPTDARAFFTAAGYGPDDRNPL